MITILTMAAKMDTPGLLKIKVFWNKGCDVMDKPKAIYVFNVWLSK